MGVLVDTNVLLRCADPAHRMHEEAVEAVRALRRWAARRCAAAQNLIEFRAACRSGPSARGGQCREASAFGSHLTKPRGMSIIPTLIARMSQVDRS